MASAPWQEFKLKAGRISVQERLYILNSVGKLVQEKYNEIVSYNVHSYNLTKLKGFLKYESDPVQIDNYYFLEGPDKHWTDIANYFEYGTGIYNVKRAGKYRAGYIKPVAEQYLCFFWKKQNRFVKTKQIRGVKPVFAMTKAIEHVESTFKFDKTNTIYRKLRYQYQND